MIFSKKYGMMGWTEDDDVLATQRFGPDVQRDYRLETAAAAAEPPAEQPAALPATGAPAVPWRLVWLVAGLASLGAGVAVRRRSVH